MKVRLIALLLTLFAGFGLAVFVAAAQDGTLRVLSSNGVKAAMEELFPEGQQVDGLRLTMSFGTSASVRRDILGGEAFDVAILTTEVLDSLTTEGKIIAASRAPLGRSGIGIGMRSGARVPDISNADALKRTLLSARSLTYAGDGASRPHIARMFDALGIDAAVKPKTVLEQGSLRATARVARGDSELVITLVSEILPIPGIKLVGPLPATFQNYVSFAAGSSTAAAHAEGARALLAFLASQRARDVFVAKGIEHP